MHLRELILLIIIILHILNVNARFFKETSVENLLLGFVENTGLEYVVSEQW